MEIFGDLANTATTETEKKDGETTSAAIGVILGIILTAVFCGGFMYLAETSDNPLNYDEFVVVRSHTIGNELSSDTFQMYTNGIWFKTFGPGHGSRIHNTSSKTRDGSIESLRNIISDQVPEYVIIEHVTREQLQ